MRFKPHHIYTHVGMLDVCFKVRKVWCDHTRAKLKISWYLKRGLVPMGFTDNIEVVAAQYNNYREL